MLSFKLTPLGTNILLNYCKRNPLFETYIIDEPEVEKGFMVRRRKTKGFVYIYNKFKFGKLFIVKKDAKVKGMMSDEEEPEDYYLYADTNLIYELDIEELNELVDIMELCQDKSEDKVKNEK